jgi:hypothetical protein
MNKIFAALSGTDALDASISKFRELRDSYRDANREYYGDYLFSILDEK